jgi:hypothetical protein
MQHGITGIIILASVSVAVNNIKKWKRLEK